MRIGTQISYSGGFAESVRDVVELEKAGLDVVTIPEAYSFDAVSQLGYVAAKTERVQLASGILQIYTRTPTLTAMTAAGLDFVSDGRFILGIGASGPQVVEGFHGVRYDAPLGRTREIVEICRQVWRRERVVHDGKHYQIPLPADQGTGLGKPLKIINHPVRERIPVQIAAIGPKNVALTAEIAEGWQPIFFHPERAAEVWGEALAEGRAKRDPSLGELDVAVGVPVAIGEDVGHMLDWVRPVVALYVGGMGARGKNFYNELACRYGYEAEAKLIQDLYLDGKKEEAAAAIPAELLEAISLVGPKGLVKERLAALRAAGVTTLQVTFLEPDPARRVGVVSELRELLS
ncbi:MULTISPECIES: LLM class F420-dependent oxidoreductase [Amycolatopsis]|uniref:LLM class F420-dependent oxidoreductase n=1 Tax=Amycolatopsis thermalba TaxID=944492 RepID=A0ABY4NVR5_9PSEU|nr:MULTISPECIES: LLM class F420-dependent oxidoreductase [Amycolatopsis]OXM71884.1 LLM class F420-dependent oxidoreductase [Amycolatopsis sp. KNN50.9b]UQS24138.1 LLM class F420-dependent oxidoreductase [Amycolatopsis thermalba]